MILCPRPCRWLTFATTVATIAILQVSSFDIIAVPSLNSKRLGKSWVAHRTAALPLFLSSSGSPQHESNQEVDPTIDLLTDDDGNASSLSLYTQSRRSTLSTLVASAAAAVSLGTTMSPIGASVAHAAEEAGGASGGAVNEVLLRLKNIPTFCIVNSDGVPLMIFDGQASATGYFFLSFNVAKTVLEDARSKDKAKDAQDKWADATIISLPLTVALQLGLRKVQRKAVNNGILFNTYNDIVPSEEGVEDAKRIDRKNPDRWIQKGRVPIFFVNGLTVDEGRYSPRYFNLADLQSEWKKQFPDKDLSNDDIQVVEMVELFRASLGSNGSIDALQNIKFVPVVDSQKVASELQKTTASIKYNLKEVYLVQSAKG